MKAWSSEIVFRFLVQSGNQHYEVDELHELENRFSKSQATSSRPFFYYVNNLRKEKHMIDWVRPEI